MQELHAMNFIGPFGKLSVTIELLVFTAIVLRQYDGQRNLLKAALCSLTMGVLINIGLLLIRTVLPYGNDVQMYLQLFVTLSMTLLWYRLSLNQALYVMGITYAMQYIAYSVWYSACVLLLPDFQFFVNTWATSVLYVIAMLLNMAILWRFTKAYKYMSQIQKFSLPILIFFLVVIWAATTLTMWAFELSSLRDIMMVKLMSSCICGLSMACVSLILVHQQVKINQAMQALLLERQKAEFERTQQNMEAINIKCHDLKYQVRSLYKKMKGDEETGLKEIESMIDQFQCSYHTGNEALDIIISEKALLCEQKKIVFTFMGDGSLMKLLADVDIYRLFNNAIDNAIEAVEKVAPEKRVISVSILRKGPFASVHVENYCTGNMKLVDGLPQTSKEDKLNHGFGVRSIKMITEQYGGELFLRCEEDVFILDLLFPVGSRERP